MLCPQCSVPRKSLDVRTLHLKIYYCLPFLCTTYFDFDGDWFPKISITFSSHFIYLFSVRTVNTCTGPALNAAKKVMQHVGGKLLLFQSSLPSIGKYDRSVISLLSILLSSLILEPAPPRHFMQITMIDNHVNPLPHFFENEIGL